jgi:hemerythrin-like domain-containing protein
MTYIIQRRRATEYVSAAKEIPMDTIAVLSAQHQEVLARLAAVEAQLSGHDAELADFATFLEGDVVQHFALEEDALFPLLARHPGVAQGPLSVMHQEHAAFRELLNSLRGAVRAHDVDAQRAHASDVIELLRAHIMKEDHVLFPMGARVLSADEQREVDARAAALGARAASPQGTPES